MYWSGQVQRTPRPAGGGGHDPRSHWRAGLAGNRAHRYEAGLPVAVLAGPGGAAARSAERPSILLPGTQGRPSEGDLA